MSAGIACPGCSSKVASRPLNTWKYAAYDVKRYRCGQCGSKFNVYQSPKRTFTIPKGRSSAE